MDALAVDIRLSMPRLSLDVSLLVPAGTHAVVGPSGAGKTTLLRCIAGLTTPHEGSVRIGDQTWFDAARGIDRAPERRSTGFVFQSYALFEHMTVAQNIAFAGPAGDIPDRLGIAHLAAARPSEISGGERQRVALARALARRPRLLLLDEPLAALDPQTRDGVSAELAATLHGLEIPTLVVTHSFTDAATLASTVAVLEAGRIVQRGTPAELVAAPAGAFVAGLTGANVVRGTARSDPGGLTTVTLPDGVTVYSTDRADGDVSVMIHPWDVSLALSVPQDSALNHIAGPVRSVTRLGNRARVRVGEITAEVTTASLDRLGVHVGAPVVATFKATATRLAAPGTRTRAG